MLEKFPHAYVEIIFFIPQKAHSSILINKVKACQIYCGQIFNLFNKQSNTLNGFLKAFELIMNG